MRWKNGNNSKIILCKNADNQTKISDFKRYSFQLSEWEWFAQQITVMVAYGELSVMIGFAKLWIDKSMMIRSRPYHHFRKAES